jgi:acyl carrier protein
MTRQEMTDASMLQIVRDAIAEVARGGDYRHITFETNIAALGLDSMAATEVAACIEDRLGVILPDDRMSRAASVGDLIAAIRDQAADRL